MTLVSAKNKAKLKAEVITYFRSFVNRSFGQFSDMCSVNEKVSQDAETKGDALEREVISAIDRVICVARFAKKAHMSLL